VSKKVIYRSLGTGFVLVSARKELIFLPVAAVFWIWYQKNVDMLMFRVVAMK